MPGSSQLFHDQFPRTPDSRIYSDILYSQLRYQALLIQKIRIVHLLQDLMINSDEILSIEVYRIDNEERRWCKQAVVTGVLFNVKCHRICVFFLFRYLCPDIRGLEYKNALSQFNEISKEEN